ncbi:unnamed protein product [Euphydryas editha]|uniref:Uncharacterized protein n=1 Tax=Euphydryas editha TaxID=104508 RepID=A0AAU9V629_EUPED|nr:unnamed protein product [Euphydryas editha]
MQLRHKISKRELFATKADSSIATTDRKLSSSSAGSMKNKWLKAFRSLKPPSAPPPHAAPPDNSSRSRSTSDCVCQKCWQRYIQNRQSKQTNNIQIPTIEESSEDTKDLIRLDTTRASSTQSKCIFGCH